MKPSSAQGKGSLAHEKKPSVDQTPELDTHPRALQVTPDTSFALPDAAPGLVEPLTRTYFDKAGAPAGMAATVNARCPVMQKMKLGEFTAQEHTVEFDGAVIGFCCQDCVDAWKVMDDDERRLRIRQVTEKK